MGDDLSGSKFMESLVGLKIKTPLNKKLLLSVLTRNYSNKNVAGLEVVKIYPNVPEQIARAARDV